MNPYQYRPLRKEEGEIRLIRLLPGHGSDDVTLEIFHAPLDSDNVVYEALSYAWGSSEKTNRVIVQHMASPFPIDTSRRHKLKSFQLRHLFTQWREKVAQSLHRKPSMTNKERQEPTSVLGTTSNLAVALIHLRENSSVINYTAHGRILWIDAICINQQDIVERSDEVGRMKSIYSKARQVIVWLGPKSNNSTRAMKTLADIAPGIVNYNANTHKFKLAEDCLARKLYDHPEHIQAAEADWIAIRDLLRRPWFRRLWVYQEIHLAAEATIVVGCASLPWSSFQNIVVWLQALIHHDTFVSQIIRLEEIENIRNFCTTLTTAGAKQFEYLIGCTAHLTCIDPKDRIYALLGLSNEEVLLQTIPSYSSSTEEVYLDVVTRKIGAQPNLTHLYLCGMPSDAMSQSTSSSSVLQCPSWVPDFTLRQPIMLAGFNDSSGRSRHEAVIRADGALEATGILSSVIVHIGKGVSLDADEDEIRAIVRSWILADSQLITASYVGGGTWLDAFVISMVGDRIAERRPSGYGGYSTVESCRRIFLAICDDADYNDAKIPFEAQVLLLGRKYFRTSNGYLGICPNATEAGDYVAAILGVNSLTIVRPMKDAADHYQIVGECYLHRWMDCEAFVGSLPNEWTSDWQGIKDDYVRTYRCGDWVTQQDPRLGVLPPSWKVVFIDNQGIEDYAQEFDEDGNIRHMRFIDTTTGQRTNCDPRLTSTSLRSRGVHVKDLIIV